LAVFADLQLREAVRVGNFISRTMKGKAKRIVEYFEMLSDLEKREVLSQLLRAVKEIEYVPPADEELISGANAALYEYDRRELNK
jgi:hypothetical protein